MITQEVLKKHLQYDSVTGKWIRLVARYDKYINVETGWVCKPHNKKYVYIDLLGSKYRSHRLSVLYMTGSFPSDEVDHINGDGTDNRWSTLRCVSKEENRKNVKLQSNNSTGRVGVYFNKTRNHWIAKINAGKKTKTIGAFNTLQDAINARSKAEIEYSYHENHGSNRSLYG